MELLQTLFNPNGTVRGKPYWLGAIVLVLLAFILQFLGFVFTLSAENIGEVMRGSVFSMLLWLLIYPYFCLYGKRLHDMGHPATWFLLILLIYVIVNWIVQMVVTMPVMMGSMEEMLEQMGESVPADGETPDISKVLNSQIAMQQTVAKKTMWPILASSAVVSLALSGVIGSFKSKLKDNPYIPDTATFD